jgi:pyruvate/2-oxoglutarate/acetoin dehydrogenase E1 component/TPP-dependent pyruvate/acetoin dehydrogenase alpha subunit
MAVIQTPRSIKKNLPEVSTEEVLNDYFICVLSREASLMARREVLTGKAKFGIIGDGKELPQVVLARYCEPGDFRSGYYRDQTWMFAAGMMTVEQFFAQLYADPAGDPFSAGRQMNCHFGSALLDKSGRWLDHTAQFNSSADVSPTAGQMARALGLAQASAKYRNLPNANAKGFSNNGREISMVSIGDASTSEGVFWETINAASVLKVPLAVMVWDDGYGISVPIEFQTTKSSISKALAGFEKEADTNGMTIYTSKGHDYMGLHGIFSQGLAEMRETHVPALFHIYELTQPQGHSTSGSHERYKDATRLAFETDQDCIKTFKNWILNEGIATPETLEELEEKAKKDVRTGKKRAWESFRKGVDESKTTLLQLLKSAAGAHISAETTQVATHLEKEKEPTLGEVVAAGREALLLLYGHESTEKKVLSAWCDNILSTNKSVYQKHFHAEDFGSISAVPAIKVAYDAEAPSKNGSELLNAFFDLHFAKNQSLLAFGEDVGQIGDVNQGFAGLQEKYGVERVFDCGIREWTIMGQAIGLSMRGFRPIAEIQYLDYLIYALSALSDDLATLRWRSNGQQAAPAIVRSRGHRLEGVWHAGSPLGLIVNSLRGMHICVPRDMTRAAGMYNTLLQGMDPALVIECLNGYRLKETVPNNLDTFTIALGYPEILHGGSDITLVTYGSCVRVAQKAIDRLTTKGISVELIDVQTLLPFDISGIIVQSLKKTNRLLILDEDVPGGASAYIMREILEVQNGYRWLDAPPTTLTAAAHRPPFGNEGDYFCKPQAEDVFDACVKLVQH